MKHSQLYTILVLIQKPVLANLRIKEKEEKKMQFSHLLTNESPAVQ